MGRKGASLVNKLSTPTLNVFKGAKHSVVSVGTSVTQVPATNLDYRKGLVIQNKHTSNVVYIGSGLPYLIIGDRLDIYADENHDKRTLIWNLSANGADEWYLSASSKTDPGLTQIRYLYYASVGDTSETLATNGTVSSLGAEHNWGWGDGDTLGWSTLYIRTDGSAAANNPAIKYKSIVAYYFQLTADDAATGGIELAASDSIALTVDGSVYMFAIASGATTPVGILELV